MRKFWCYYFEINNNKFNVKPFGCGGHLGGEDFDNILINFCIKEFNEHNV